MEILLYIIILIILAVFITILISYNKIGNRLKNIARKLTFLEDEQKNENKKIRDIINQQYTDVLMGVKKLEPEEPRQVDDSEYYDQAKEIVMKTGKASATLLQRRLRTGYAQAARLLDYLEEQGIVGPTDGSKPREVIKQ